jgi:hypothetical protein
MNMGIVLALNDVSVVLKDRGFIKEAAIVDAATFSMPHGVGKVNPMMSQYPGVRSQGPTETGTAEPLEKGDLVTELDPVTGKEIVRLWGIHKPMTLDELAEAVKKGHLAVDYFNEQYQNAKDPDNKKFFKDMLNRAEIRRKQWSGEKLASLSKQLLDKGYDTLGRRLKEASDKIL